MLFLDLELEFGHFRQAHSKPPKTSAFQLFISNQKESQQPAPKWSNLATKMAKLADLGMLKETSLTVRCTNRHIFHNIQCFPNFQNVYDNVRGI